MRLLMVLILGAVLGWFAGSLYPAPQSWLQALHLDAMQQHPSEGALSQNPTTVLADAPAPQSTAPAPGATPSNSQAAAHPGPVDDQTLNQYRAWISAARTEHPYAESEERMYAVMLCESRGQARLVAPSGSYSGLFQYSPSTWSGAWNTYRDQNILDPRAQIFATALAWHNHMQGQWGCYSHPH
jgi:hypothetical protein